MLELNDLSKRFGDVHALGPITLRIPERVTTALIGPSGCGKSTLLRLALGLLEPDRGSVTFEGRRLDRSRLAEARLRMGYVVQNGGLFPHLTARQNVTLMARQQRWPAARVEKRMDELAELSRLPLAALDRYPLELSTGQCQRVSLMRALMLDPDLLLLDEPLGAIDPLVRHELQTDLREIFARLGKTVVLVTHDLAEAVHFSRNLVLLREGRLVQQGTVDDLLSRPADPFVTRYFGACRPFPGATAPR
jgi:osmoprotectant transport system ATP-binding protein